MQLWFLLFALFVCLLACPPVPAPPRHRRCVYLASAQNVLYLQRAGRVSGRVQHCTHTPCCMGYFKLVDGGFQPDLQGCNVLPMQCPEDSCFASTHRTNYTACVCNTDFCNANLTWLPTVSTPARGQASLGLYSVSTAVMPLGTLLFLCGLIMAVRWRKHLCNSVAKARVSEGTVTSQCSCDRRERLDCNVAELELQQMLGQGHFASVWRGCWGGAAVAVKVFPPQQRQQFLRERDVHMLPLMEHVGVVCFLGAGSKMEGGDTVLVMELAHHGSLRSFLLKNTSGWSCWVRLCQSLSQGLAFLHSDLHRNGMHKPAVAHGDLSSSNVLVRADGTCALCDFGCSAVLRSCSGRRQHRDAAQVSVQVGTLCYLSPEMLEGCVNLRSRRYLMQGDVYALGLLLWELSSRCVELTPGQPPLRQHGSVVVSVGRSTVSAVRSTVSAVRSTVSVGRSTVSVVRSKHAGVKRAASRFLSTPLLFPAASVSEHRLPYEVELGACPSLEELLRFVCERRGRPRVPRQWGFCLQGGFTLSEVLEDCWDHDADARLTAQCAADRLAALPPCCPM
ncbi:anti-Muellerian hormone type-2 receptor-like [Megalops cyprinoides]|uniref:anti-Muellerian hormone type-2 receptor-like n=1 Tax=Megalops cyprinoides TaxID=118141 RepID=UPI00186503F6|nr:anti-Muellerian hormone type-2 receptor-like [Megalops cyprinoides]